MQSLNNIFTNQKWLISSIFSGILIGCSYIPFPAGLMLFCFIPLWKVWLDQPNIKKTFISGWISQFILSLIGFHWITIVSVEFGHLPKAVGYLVLILFSATQFLHIPIAGVFFQILRKRFHLSTMSCLIILPLLTAFIDYVLPEVFPWNFGYVWLWGNWQAFQWADIIGFQGLHLVTLLINSFLLFSVIKNKRSSYIRTSIILILFLSLLNITGYLRGKDWDATDRTIKMASVQANIGNFEKFLAERDYNFKTTITNKYMGITDSHVLKNPETEIVIWPETALPENLNLGQIGGKNLFRLSQWIRDNNIRLLSGAYAENLQTDAYYNGIFLFNKKGIPIKKYYKTKLLAFGEYFPGSQYFPFLKKIVPDIASFGRGSGPTVFEFNRENKEPIRLGLQICYEGLFPDFSAKLAEKNSHVIINVTNDSWYGHTFESKQHLYMTLARAIEIRRPLIRSTNTGITTAVLANGDILRQGPEEEEWAYTFDIKYRHISDLTIYSQFYWIYPYILIGLILLILLKRKNARNT